MQSDGHPPTPSPAAPPSRSAELRVLASGSAGNCSVLIFEREGVRRACLIDLGISPRRTVRWLAELGLGLHSIDDVFITHLDADHFYDRWRWMLPGHVTVRMHAAHARRVGRGAFEHARLEAIEDRVVVQHDLAGGMVVSTLLTAHDIDGSTSFRFDMPALAEDDPGGSLGFVTDVGRVTGELIQQMRGVNVLAIESNYCPRMQEESDRPEVLKRRVMGGYGHLSNHEAVDAIRRIRPSEHVVLLHLSRECNDPALVTELHERRAGGHEYGFTVTSQTEPSRPVRISPRRTPAVESVESPLPAHGRQMKLFVSIPAGASGRERASAGR